jgi:hypothetical protein
MLRFKHRLALALRRSVAEIDRLDVHELRDWIAYHRFIEPIGGESRWFARLILAVRAPWSKVTVTEDELLGVESLPMTGNEINSVLARLWSRRR